MKNSCVVLLPVYKEDKLIYFKEAIDSLGLQTYQDFDIVILIDGPIKAQLYDYIFQLKTNSKITIFEFKKNSGLSIVLNIGLRYCLNNGYKYLARMDADDISIRDRFEKQIKFLESNSEVDVVGGGLMEINESGNFQMIIIHPLTHIECFQFFKKRNPIAHPTVVFRDSFFRKAGFYSNEHVGMKNWEDTILWYSGFKNGCVFANIEDVIYKMRISREFFMKRRHSLKRAIYYIRDRYKINRNLGYGIYSQINLFLFTIILISPLFLIKFAYKYLR